MLTVWVTMAMERPLPSSNCLHEDSVSPLEEVLKVAVWWLGGATAVPQLQELCLLIPPYRGRHVSEEGLTIISWCSTQEFRQIAKLNFLF